jgi:tetratricopeptide (TPR) repeat protein
VYRFEPFPLAPGAVARERAREQPSYVLGAERRVVEFTGRKAELAELAAWRDSPAPGVSVMLLHGPGGQGKTRLAARLAELSAAAGWTVWAAHHLSDPTALTVVAPGESGPALLLVVEYAERWPVDDLQLMLGNPLLRRPRRSRVLLVSRSAGPWWPALRHRLGKADFRADRSVALGPLAGTVRERRRMFAAACARYAAADLFDVADHSSIEPPSGLARDSYGLVLTLHMAALVAVDARSRGQSPPGDPVGLSTYLLDREHDYWQSAYDHGRVVTPPQVMARAVYAATLARPQRREQAVALLRQVEVTAGVVGVQGLGPDRIVTDHAVCYPAAAGPDGVLEPLYPDRLGEDFLALRLPGHDVPGYQPDEWASGSMPRLLALDEWRGSRGWIMPPRPWIRSVIAGLTEAAERWPHLTRDYLIPLLRQCPQLALAGGSDGLMRIAAAPEIDLGTLRTIHGSLPPHGHALIDTGVPALLERLINEHGKRASPVLYHDLAWQAAETGNFEWAARATEQRLRAYRKIRRRLRIYRRIFLRKLDPATFRQLERDIADAEHLIPYYRELAETSPAVWQARRARYWRRRDLWQALPIDRRMAQFDPAAFEPGLLASLVQLIPVRHEKGRREEGIAAAEEALAISRRLVVPHTLYNEAETAHSLLHLADELSDLRRPGEAAEVLQQALSVSRSVKAISLIHDDDLEPGFLLVGLCSRLRELGRPEEALIAAQRGIDALLRAAKPRDGDGREPLRPDLIRTEAVGWLDAAASLLSDQGHAGYPRQAAALREMMTG